MNIEVDAPAGTVRPDADKIFELINVWDHRCPEPRACPHRSWAERGAVTRFARRIGRARSSLWNLRAPGKRVGPAFITQIADTLRVPWSTITLPDTAATAAAPQPEAEVRKAA